MAAAACASCGAPLAPDQRYCLECGERRVPMSSVLAGGRPGGQGQWAAPAGPRPPAGSGPADPAEPRNGTLAVIAGVGVLLLAMGVGVLIGRSSASRQSAAPAQVISVASGGGAGTSTTAANEGPFTGDWPSGTKGYTVQLQTLPQAGTTVSALETAKSQATAKGAKAVGALKSDEFSSLTAGSYVIYSGVYHKRSEAQKALGGLKKSFPGASVVEVSSGSSSSGAGGSGSSITHPAPATVLEGLKSAKGKSYEEKSKNLPNVVSTG